MKNNLIFVALISIICLSCNGKPTKKEALERAVFEFNQRNSNVEIIAYHPETYTEVVTDTIIANKTKVHIKNYSLLDEHILVSKTTDAVSKKINYQRVFASEIHISIASKDILSTHLSTKQFKTLVADPFWDHATLQHTWVNQELSNITNIVLDISFINPRNQAYKLYRMSVNVDGHQTINLIEEQS